MMHIKDKNILIKYFYCNFFNYVSLLQYFLIFRN